MIRQIKCQTPETLDQLRNRIHANEHELIVEGTQLAISKLWKDREAAKSD